MTLKVRTLFSPTMNLGFNQKLKEVVEDKGL
jgi:hypothetical protein